MKKASVLLALFLCLGLAAGCITIQLPPPTERPQDATESAPPTEEPVPAKPEPISNPDLTTAPLEIDEVKLNAMLPIFDALIGAAHERTYAAADSDFFWAAIYLMSVNYFTQHTGVYFDGDNLEVPAAIVEEYARALFADFAGLPKLSADLAIDHDVDRNVYVMGMSDGNSYTTILGITPGVAGNAYVTVRMSYYEDDYSEDYEFEIVANNHIHPASSISPTFYYSVAGMSALTRNEE